ncbi:MAG TPA: methylmalonyl Co-A mutase-associated GTPase MeaB [Thermodesulfobacteriota bacterium]|nr:methylmalonyl Co-A mutase-associated GTPase MeaB [Thermodesulfobacteriota bacterium]
MSDDNNKEPEVKTTSDTASSESVRTNQIQKFKRKRRKQLPLDEYVDGILQGNRVILSQAITLVESALPEHGELAQEIIEKCLPHTGNSVRLGITGIPGVGKSTFIESFGTYLTQKENRKVTVLAIDPTSQRTKGSILGDKTRMEKLSSDPNAFIRPSPSSGSLGGVAQKTREAILLCEAAGFNTIIVETIGVGQSETAVHSMVDFFLLLMLPGVGDEIQGIKRGIIEMADAIAITKADADKEKAEHTKKEFQNILHFYPPTAPGWTPEVVTCSSLTNEGIGDIWQIVLKYHNMMKNKSYLAKKRQEQARNWMHETIKQSLERNFYSNEKIKRVLDDIENDIIQGKISSSTAVKKLLDIYHHK